MSKREQHRIRHPFRCRCGFSAFFLQKGDFRLVKGNWGCLFPFAACANRLNGSEGTGTIRCTELNGGVKP
jgi:hypothetical protein